jgi:Ca2+-binding RTX toxin-like protein
VLGSRDRPAGWNTFYGSFEEERFYGGPGNDHLVGSFGADVLDGGGGHDVLAGLEGDDVLKDGDLDGAALTASGCRSATWTSTPIPRR